MYYNNGTTRPLEMARDFFNKPSVLPRLILINIGVFILVYLVNLIFWLFQLNTSIAIAPLTNLLAVPSAIDTLLMKPWTPLTYMFLHEGFIHLLFNMIILFFGGSIFLQYLDEKKLLNTYIFGGLSGAFFYILAYNFFPVFLASNPHVIALGASASVLAVLIAIATYVPQYVVNLFLLGPVRMKYIALFLILMDIFSIQGNNPGGHIAHLGGAFYGFIFAWGLRNNFSFPEIKIPNLGRKKIKTTYRSPGNFNERPINDEEFNKRKVLEQQEIDKILDKISKSGYDSLNKHEKELLFRKSNKD